MPCNSRITVQLKLDKARIEVLDKAMKALGFVQNGPLSWASGGTVVSLDGNQLGITGRYGVDALRQQIQRATSAEVVKAAAARNGWKLTWLQDGTKAEATRITYSK